MTTGADMPPLVFLVAGEPSGDALGARLMAALKARTGGAVRFAGVGGEGMADQGLDSLFPMAELSVMGVAEVLPRLPRILRRLAETARAARRLRPAAVVTIDAPDFCFRLAKRLRGAGIPLIHYVAPSVWAWRPGRARKIAGFLDHLLALLPFEPPYFEREGLACTFVGHPVVESGADLGDGRRFRERHGIAAGAPLVCVLPGSRRSETARLLPVFAQAVAGLRANRPDLRAVVPVIGAVADEVARAAAGWPVPATVVHGRADKIDAFAAADVALAASGTVALELAMAETPAVIAYRVNPLTAWLARRLVRVPYANLVNLVLDRPAVPELIQEDCRPERLTAALDALFVDEAARRAQVEAGREALTRLGRGGPSPGERAAAVVLDVIAGK
ncbi:lipid-A-disaccharide synthase [Shumkonia mesophila]|uniref:lipid-A-disaccharide synthase n=1 Tax=Shumkonia mesophila TaxID=2838854 RepID=UPI0029341701|nr:lipid-A-disaccharide synthase [Shumkonia mesophila]